jgi:hypothetical protein
MLIASLRCQKQRMAFLIVQHDENTAPKHFSKTLSEGSPQSIDWVVAQTELNESIQARTGSHRRTCCSPSLAAAAVL